jgi:hypothetical protein
MFSAMVLMMPIANAQKTPFRGTIIFDVTAVGNLPEMTKTMMPTVMTYKYSTDKQSMALNFAMGDQKTIFDPATKTVRILMNVIGQKIVINQTAAELDQLRKQEGETIGVKETNDTKTIAGYLCKKTVLTKKTKDGKENISNIYFTDAIDVSKFKSFNPFPEINGFPLDFSMKSGAVEFKVVARTITKETIPASEFEVSPDYKLMTVADLQKFLGGAGSLLGK